MNCFCFMSRGYNIFQLHAVVMKLILCWLLSSLELTLTLNLIVMPSTQIFHCNSKIYHDSCPFGTHGIP